MNQSDENERFCLDNLSDCSVSSLETDNSNSSEESDLNPQKRRRTFPLQVSDSHNNDANVAVDETTWSIHDKTITMEPFGGTAGVKIMPKSKESIRDVIHLFLGDDFFEYMLKESNRYHYQIINKYKGVSKTKKWNDITLPEIKKFLGLIVLMGQVKKDVLFEYWSTDASIETPFFSKIMSRNRFMQIMQSWHFCNNESIPNNCRNRLIKVQPIIDYLKKRFNDVYRPSQQLSLDESIIPWRGKLLFKTCNPAKVTKYGILIRVLCEADTGYICNFEMYAAQEKKLEPSILSIVEPYKDMWHHIYQDNYCNSVHTAETLLKNKVRLCGTIRTNRNLPECLKKVQVSRGETVFRRKDNILIQIWNNGKRNVNMISTIHSARLIESSSISRKPAVSVQKPESIIDYNKYMKGVDRADQHLSYYSIFRKTKKWTNRVVMFLINCALFNAYKVHIALMGKKVAYKKFLHEVSLLWLANSETIESASLANSEINENENLPSTSNIPEPTKRTPRFDHQERLSNLAKHKLTKIVTRSGSKNPQRHCRVCISKGKRSKTSFVCTFCNIPLHKGDCFLRYHTLHQY